jgi:hypothetical protein
VKGGTNPCAELAGAAVVVMPEPTLPSVVERERRIWSLQSYSMPISDQGFTAKHVRWWNASMDTSQCCGNSLNERRSVDSQQAIEGRSVHRMQSSCHCGTTSCQRQGRGTGYNSKTTTGTTHGIPFVDRIAGSGTECGCVFTCAHKAWSKPCVAPDLVKSYSQEN